MSQRGSFDDTSARNLLQNCWLPSSTKRLHTLQQSTMYEFELLKQQGAFEHQFTIERLVELSGASRRSIYGYVKAGVVDLPDRSGRQHIWTRLHLRQIAEVRRQTKAGTALVALSPVRASGSAKSSAKARSVDLPPSPPILNCGRISFGTGLVLLIDRKLTKGERDYLRKVGAEVMAVMG